MPPSGYPGVVLAYASVHGAAFIDRALYLPRDRSKDQGRRAEAGIPAGMRFASKITLAERMLARAVAAGVPARRVVADCFSGRSGPFRRWLEEREQPDAVMLPRTNAIDDRGRHLRVEQVAERLMDPESSGWRCVALSEDGEMGMGRWLSIRCDADNPGGDASWLVHDPAATIEGEVVRVRDTRWQVGGWLRTGERGVGMDQYAVRIWTACHRFVTLCLLAHVFLTVVRHVARRDKGAEREALLPLSSPSPYRKGAVWSSPWPNSMGSGRSAGHGRGGAGRTKSLGLAATPPVVLCKSWEGIRFISRRICRRDTGRSAMPNGNASDLYSRCRSLRSDDCATTSAPY